MDFNFAQKNYILNKVLHRLSRRWLMKPKTKQKDWFWVQISMFVIALAIAILIVCLILYQAEKDGGEYWNSPTIPTSSPEPTRGWEFPGHEGPIIFPPKGKMIGFFLLQCYLNATTL